MSAGKQPSLKSSLHFKQGGSILMVVSALKWKVTLKTWYGSIIIQAADFYEIINNTSR